MDEGGNAGQPSQPALSEIERRLHRVLIDRLLATDEVPDETTLASDLDIDLNILREALRTLERGDYLALNSTRQVTCLYPISTVPTVHVVIVDGARRFAMCSLDALGVAAMLGRPVAIESACAACDAPIRIEVRPGHLVTVEPPPTRVVARGATEAPAVEACCAFTVFACGPAHAREVLERSPNTVALALGAALEAGEALFRDLLAETLPARRRRTRP